MTTDSLPAIRGKGDVVCRVFGFFEDLEDVGILTLEELLAESPWSPEYVKEHRNKIPWDDWAAICDRFLMLMGSQAECEVVCERLVNTVVFDSLKGAAGAMFSPRQLYKIGYRYLGPMTLSNLRYTMIDTKGGPLTSIIELDESYASARSWFITTRVALRMIPNLSGYPDSVIITKELSDHRMELEIAPPVSRTWVDRIRRRFSGVGSQGSLEREFEFFRGALKTANEALKTAEVGFERVLEAMPLSVVLHNAGEIHYKNHHATQLMGKKNSLHDVVDEADADALMDLLSRTSEGEPTELRFVSNRRTYMMASNVEGPEFEGQQLDLFLALDVTRWRDLQEQVSINERMASLGTLTAGIAHEINNPLTSVLGNLELALMSLDSPEASKNLRSYLEDALVGADRASVIVQDMHAFARKRKLDFGAIDLQKVLDTAIRLSKPHFQNVALVKVFEDTSFAHGDEQQLTQIFVNLLTNAAQACGPDGRVTVRLFENMGPEVWISDNGHGMSAWMISKIFEPFFSTKSGEGLGLGLAITQRLMQAMDSEISVESAEGEGTQFRLSFKPAMSSPVLSNKPVAPVRGLTILVIEDDPLVRRTLTWALGEHNNLTVLHSAVGALCHVSEVVDVIICDLVMPEKTGMEFYGELCAERPDLAAHVVFMSGGSMSAEYEGFIQTNRTRMMLKPFSINELHVMVDKAARK